jgi:hypothetical protein
LAGSVPEAEANAVSEAQKERKESTKRERKWEKIQLTSQLATLRYDPEPFADATFICFIDIDTHVLIFPLTVSANSDVRIRPYNPTTKKQTDVFDEKTAAPSLAKAISQRVYLVSGLECSNTVHGYCSLTRITEITLLYVRCFSVPRT